MLISLYLLLKIFMDMAVLVEAQGEILDSIENQVHLSLENKFEMIEI